MDAKYLLRHPDEILSPSLLFYKDLIRQNIAGLLARAGSPERLRPHVKTHKTREIARMEMDAGIAKHKCATIAEAEMLAQVGVPDILLSYPMLGPNAARFARLVQKYPQSRFSTLVDHPVGVKLLSAALSALGVSAEVLIDLDVGQNRTGIAPGPEALALYKSLAVSPGLIPGGLHVYDGHNHAEKPEDRQKTVSEPWQTVLAMRTQLLKEGLPVPRLVLGGTPSFPVWAKIDLPGVELSPGTAVLHDNGYGTRFRDMPEFVPAALVFSRVISKPTPTRLTLDVGYKAIAGDPPAGKRCILLNIPQYEAVLHNEEHLVVETPNASQFQLGDPVYAVPTHICPTCALHKQALVVENGEVTGAWEILARDRMLTV